MYIEVKQPRDTPISLPAAEYLESTKDQVSGDPEKGIRHPAATYNLSVKGVISAANNVMADLENGYPLVGDSGAKRILSMENLRGNTKQLILAMGEHVDACEKIISCYLRGKGNLKKANESLRKSLGSYERHVMVQANHIKHRHSQIRSIAMNDQHIVVPGYYIESAIGEGTVGPDPIVHGKKNSAFSYAREMRLLICGLFFISRSLSSELRRYVGNSAPSKPQEENSLMELIDRVAKFPAEMFPDEYNDEMPVVDVTANNFLISFGHIKPPEKFFESIQFEILTEGDGISNAFQIPYLDTKPEKK